MGVQFDVNTKLLQKVDWRSINHVRDNFFKEDLSLSDYQGAVCIFVFLPFTFVCPSEIVAFDRNLDKFKKKCAVIS